MTQHNIRMDYFHDKTDDEEDRTNILGAMYRNVLVHVLKLIDWKMFIEKLMTQIVIRQKSGKLISTLKLC